MTKFTLGVPASLFVVAASAVAGVSASAAVWGREEAEAEAKAKAKAKTPLRAALAALAGLAASLATFLATLTVVALARGAGLGDAHRVVLYNAWTISDVYAFYLNRLFEISDAYAFYLIRLFDTVEDAYASSEWWYRFPLAALFILILVFVRRGALGAWRV